jgi:hypothetical protein
VAAIAFSNQVARLGAELVQELLGVFAQRGYRIHSRSVAEIYRRRGNSGKA